MRDISWDIANKEFPLITPVNTRFSKLSWRIKCFSHHLQSSPDRSQVYAHSLPLLSERTVIIMRFIFVLCGLVLSLHLAEAQFFNALANLFRPVTNLLGGQRFTDDGTRRPKADGVEETFPREVVDTSI